jgi:hypothetical protein
MRQVSDEFLLNVAVISATLLGLLVVGVLFYVETGLRRLEHARNVIAPYIRGAARLTMAMYVGALGTSLALVALEPVWARIFYGAASAGVVLSLLDYTARARAMGEIMGRAAWSPPQEVLTWAMTAAVLALPWVLGGFAPGRESFTWGLLLLLLFGLLSTLSILLAVFDIAKFESAFGNRARE